MNVVITRIEWDTDGLPVKDCLLPEVVVMINAPYDAITEEISDALTEAFGFCHDGFEWEPMRTYKTTHAGGGFYPENLGVCEFQ